MAIFKRMLSSPASSAVPSRKTSSHFNNSCNESLLFNSELESLDVSALCWYPYKELRRDMLRLLVFSDKDGRLMYDSETVVHVNDRVMPGAKKTPCGRFQLLPHNPDTGQISKMLFGSMGTSMKADSLKIHTLLSTDSLMISRLFSVSKNKKGSPSRSCNNKCMASSLSSDSDSQYYSTIRSLDAIRDLEACNRGLTKTTSYSNTDPPEGFHRLRNSSLQLDGPEVLEELKNFSPNRLSRARRRQLSLKGLCDLRDGPKSRSRLSSCSSTYENSRQLGFALMFPGEDKDFVFQHILQLEKEIAKLVAQLNKALGAGNKQFLQLVYEGWVEFCASICLLHNASRLRTPVWLSLTNPASQQETAQEFCQTLSRLCDQLNTKNSKFFLSTLLSSVLMNHLAWVASVAPPPDNCSYDRSLLLGTSVIDSRRNPYNARLAQFLELSGGVGIGNRFAKTVVLGENAQLIAEVLYILSYFIRCSSVENKKRTEVMTPDSLSPLKSFAEDNCSLEGAQDSSSSGEKRACMAYSTPNHPTTEVPMEVVSSSYDRNADSLTPPPNKTRAISTALPIHRANNPRSKQDQQQQRHYELMLDVKELRQQNLCSTNHSDVWAERTQSDFGRSLLAGICPGFSTHFVLSGIDKRQTKMEELSQAIHNDTRHPEGEPCPLSCSLGESIQLLSPNGSIRTVLGLCSSSESKPIPTIVSCSSQRSSHDEPPPPMVMEERPRAVVVVADCSTHVVRIVSSDDHCRVEDSQVFSPSEAVTSMLEEFLELYRCGCCPTFLISFIEDRLSSILNKSNVLVRLVSTSTEEKPAGCLKPSQEMEESTNKCPSSLSSSSLEPSSSTSSQKDAESVKEEIISMDQVTSILGCHCSDLRLIINVAATYSPVVLPSVV